LTRKKRKPESSGSVDLPTEAGNTVSGGHKARRIPPLRKAFYSLVVAFLFFGGAELIARLSGGAASGGPPPVGTRKFVTWLSGLSADEARGPALYCEDRRLLWRLVPNTRVTTSNHHHVPAGERQPVRITINDEGYRGIKAGGGDASAFRVLCLGDSNFFGYPLDDQFVFPRVLQDALTRGQPSRPIEVINGGVPGYSVVQGRQWYLDRFAQHRFDVILLSYLNNDAWLQPQTDTQLIERYASSSYSVSKLLQRSQLVSRLTSWLVPTVPPAEYVPRVPLDEFARSYEFFLEAAKSRTTRVIIVDYRAYPEYEPYSRQLRDLAQRYSVDYVPVAERVAERLKDLQTVKEYPELAERAYRRWGELLGQRPDLWYYAEYYPEHLNELGVAWLANQVALLIGPQLESTPTGEGRQGRAKEQAREH
jgi:lysophospholipase L1-like esterase